MRLEQFQYVVEVARCRSMSKAARQLFLSQPALSTAISNLEAELGFQVFERSFQGVALTEKGEQLLEIAKRIVEQLETIPAISQDSGETPTVNIAAVPAACNSLILDLIGRLRQHDPNTIINIQELRPIRVLAALEEHTADLCIGIHTSYTQERILKQAAQNGLQIEEVFQDTMCAYLPGGHRLARAASVARQDLLGDTPIFFSDYLHLGWHDADREALKSSRNYFSFTDQASMKRAIARGLGYAILPWQMSVDDIYISSGQVVAVPLVGEEQILTTFLAYRRNVLLPPAGQRALEVLRQLYRQLQVKQNKEGPSQGVEAL